MKQKEQRLWTRMRANLPRDILLERVENLLAAGFPDVVACANGRVTMIELKAVPRAPARVTTPLLGDEGLSIEQRNWHMKWRCARGNSLLVVSCGTGITTAHFAVTNPNYADQFEHVNNWTLVAMTTRACLVGRGTTFWPALADLLRGDA